MAKTWGYARVSTANQDLSIQEAALRAAGCCVVFSEKATGTNTDARPELAKVLSILEAGDILIFTRLDRLARSMRDLQSIAHTIRAAGAHLRALKQPIDTRTETGKAFFDMIGVFTQFETNLRKERHSKNITAAKAKGVSKGRPRKIDDETIKAMHARGTRPAHIAKTLKISRQSVYRLLNRVA